MKTNCFTLIELLVVVLIIGILAAVAVPQYQKAVAKSRYAALKPIVNSLAAAAQTYYLANGTWPSSIDDLAISLDSPVFSENGEWRVAFEEPTLGVYISRSEQGKYAGVSFSKHKQPSYNFIPNETFLCNEPKNQYAGKYCNKIMGGQEIYTGVYVTVFVLP